MAVVVEAIKMAEAGVVGAGVAVVVDEPEVVEVGVAVVVEAVEVVEAGRQGQGWPKRWRQS